MNPNDPLNETSLSTHTPKAFAIHMIGMAALCLITYLLVITYAEKAYDWTVETYRSGKVQRIINDIEDPRYKTFNDATKKIIAALR